jgi:hypothetical protein
LAGHTPKGRYTSFESVLHRLVHERIDEVIATHAMNMANGSARKDDAPATAIAYFEQIGFVQGLRAAQEICQTVATDLSRDG